MMLDIALGLCVLHLSFFSSAWGIFHDLAELAGKSPLRSNASTSAHYAAGW